MKSYEVREKFLKYFENKGHKIIPSSSLVPENDPTTLFTGSGMQPLVPYLLGKPHPEGKRLANSQKAFRSGDIEDVGDNRHTTFFEMLGNWSLGDYFKEEQLKNFFYFLTEEIGIPPTKLYVTAFIGDTHNNIPKDTESALIWQKLFKEKSIEAKEIEIGSEENGYKVGLNGGRIFYYDAKKNWWSRSGTPEKMPEGEPGGPDSEVFYEFEDIEHNQKFGEKCHPNCDCGRFLEIGNSVFMEYVKTKNGFEKLPQKNVDFGGGLERIVAVSENTSDIFLTDFFKSSLEELESLSSKKYNDTKYTNFFRVILDHLRSSVFLIADGVNPGNTDRNYFVRRLLRRSVLFWDKLDIEKGKMSTIVSHILKPYKNFYPEIISKTKDIEKEIYEEENKFRKTLHNGLNELEKLLDKKHNITGEDAFYLYQSFGLPFEITIEVAKEIEKNIENSEIILKNFKEEEKNFKEKLKEHQDLSRLGSEQKFKGGLGDTSEKSIKYHTATHLLHKALREILGDSVSQKGSNITPERLRFDFSFERKMTEEEKKKVEDLVNLKIGEGLNVKNIVLPKEEALKTGAMHLFGEKYGDQVSIYFIGDEIENAFSKEFCGGPHVLNTKDLGKFKIIKEEAVSSGVRRIKAILE